MTAQLVALSIDANDAVGLARFWSEALGWPVDDDDDGVVALMPTDETSFRIEFRAVPEPKVGRNRIHLDLTTTSLEDQRESVERLVAAGARHIDVGQTAKDPHVVLADPEGNELCIIEPQNSFLAGCGRLGALSCDGSRAVGCFWRDALGWPLVWDQGEETAIRAPSGTGPFITWGGGPEIPKTGKNRLRLDIAPASAGDQLTEVARLESLGATRLEVGGELPSSWVTMADPDGNEFCVRRAP